MKLSTREWLQVAGVCTEFSRRKLELSGAYANAAKEAATCARISAGGGALDTSEFDRAFCALAQLQVEEAMVSRTTQVLEQVTAELDQAPARPSLESIAMRALQEKAPRMENVVRGPERRDSFVIVSTRKVRT